MVAASLSGENVTTDFPRSKPAREFTEAERKTFARYCADIDRIGIIPIAEYEPLIRELVFLTHIVESSRKKFRKEGMWLKRRTGAKYQHPAVTTYAQNVGKYIATLSELGLTPSGATRIQLKLTPGGKPRKISFEITSKGERKPVAIDGSTYESF